ncbi:Flp family type IVb pilin [Bradyrhizobium sp. ISRA443]|uniref:Flp family type IVb pilin n=1 Tax=unclassified Bradyrhizobium TaxID=2631580 RepID=UPI00247A5F2E|nr:MULTISPECIES: Flp family type IVb pilin [unclassified Bradyrhizobium]WGR92829.1 Flp family type IVb pilin [Bradyrhizobium sp. ISRA435]WGR97300.1 Flp family type IVb pilin [Bradyrhizobium sp. ISRA436]WGS04189.1 Flp family type IVb pilin [Bradyrhizobium sp. ISRA437]WGS11072.1 Flp family type IVb pilin [Bradyrhizobium sp. ISRA443]
MRSLLARFMREEAGATAIEYAIIAGGLSILIVAAVGGIGANLSGRFSAMSTSLK